MFKSHEEMQTLLLIHASGIKLMTVYLDLPVYTVCLTFSVQGQLVEPARP